MQPSLKKSLIATLILVAMLCLPISFGYEDAVSIYRLIFPAILATICASLLYLWLGKTQSKAKSFLVGAVSGFAGILIWPGGWLIYTFTTNSFFRSGVGVWGLTPLFVFALIFGGLIGVCLNFGFQNPKTDIQYTKSIFYRLPFRVALLAGSMLLIATIYFYSGWRSSQPTPKTKFEEYGYQAVEINGEIRYPGLTPKDKALRKKSRARMAEQKRKDQLLNANWKPPQKIEGDLVAPGTWNAHRLEQKTNLTRSEPGNKINVIHFADIKASYARITEGEIESSDIRVIVFMTGIGYPSVYSGGSPSHSPFIFTARDENGESIVDFSEGKWTIHMSVLANGYVWPSLQNPRSLPFRPNAWGNMVDYERSATYLLDGVGIPAKYRKSFVNLSGRNPNKSLHTQLSRYKSTFDTRSVEARNEADLRRSMGRRGYDIRCQIDGDHLNQSIKFTIPTKYFCAQRRASDGTFVLPLPVPIPIELQIPIRDKYSNSKRQTQ